jgi:SAM-dependent methyltransferase
MRSWSGDRVAVLVPARRRGHELLDEPHTVDPVRIVRELRDVVRANTLFGGTRAVMAELATLFAERRGSSLTLLDVGTGLGDIPARAAALARTYDVTLVAVGLERAEALARAALRGLSGALVADAFHLPFANHSVDVIICSQLLHHFPEADAEVLLRELSRAASQRVIVSDLRRSWFAAAGVWLASFPLGFSPASRHDGALSVLRGFRVSELAALAARATGGAVAIEARDRLGFRVTASWTPVAA